MQPKLTAVPDARQCPPWCEGRWHPPIRREPDERYTLHDKPILAGEWATVTAQLIDWHDKPTEQAVFVEVDEALTPAQVSELVRALVEASLILDRPHT